MGVGSPTSCSRNRLGLGSHAFDVVKSLCTSVQTIKSTRIEPRGSKAIRGASAGLRGVVQTKYEIILWGDFPHFQKNHGFEKIS